MRKITITDVNHRLRWLGKMNSASGVNNTFSESAQLTIRTRRAYDIKRLIETAGRENKEVSLVAVMELFDALVECGTLSDIKKMGNYIEENMIHKTRDAKSASKVFKQRLTRWKNKLSVKAPSTNSTVTEKIKNADKHEAITKVYESCLNKLDIYINCDRVLENYNRISKRFNLEVVFNENTKANGVYDTVLELCSRIDTYEMPNAVKINTVIETALYGFESNSIAYNKSDILEATLDYFAFKPNGINDCKAIFEATLFYDKNDDMGNIDILTEEEPEDGNNSGDSSVDTMVRNHYTDTNDTPVVKESSEFGELFKKFKEEELSKDDAKPESKLKQLVTKLYSRNVDSIVDDTPNLLTWIRSFFIIGSAAVPVIGPILMIVSFIADRFISLHMDREEVKKMSKCFANEIKASKKKLESTSNPEDRSRLEKYIESLNKAKEKIDTYYNDLLSDADLDSAYDDMDLDDSDIGDLEGFDFGDDDEWDFGEDLDFALSEMTSRVEECMGITNAVTEHTMYELPRKVIDTEAFRELSKLVAAYPEALYKEAFQEGIKEEMIRTKNDKSYSNMDRIMRFNALENALNRLERLEAIDFSKPMTIFESYNHLAAITETYGAIALIDSTDLNNDSILEASFTNTLRLASMKLKNAFKNLSDKDKRISKNVDLSLNNLTKSAERAMTNDNREAILKGSVLPSASKILKMGIACAGLVAIHQPVLAVIAMLGYLGCSAKFKSKERQLLIDEIEIELEMCDKYIAIAEQKNDMKALKQLMTTKRDLTRQLQRIKYKMKIEFGQKYYDAKNVGDK